MKEKWTCINTPTPLPVPVLTTENKVNFHCLKFVLRDLRSLSQIERHSRGKQTKQEWATPSNTSRQSHLSSGLIMRIPMLIWIAVFELVVRIRIWYLGGCDDSITSNSMMCASTCYVSSSWGHVIPPICNDFCSFSSRGRRLTTLKAEALRLHIVVVAIGIVLDFVSITFLRFSFMCISTNSQHTRNGIGCLSVTPLEASKGFNISIFLTSCQHAFVPGWDSEGRALERSGTGRRLRVCYSNLLVRLKDGLTL